MVHVEAQGLHRQSRFVWYNFGILIRLEYRPCIESRTTSAVQVDMSNFWMCHSLPRPSTNLVGAAASSCCLRTAALSAAAAASLFALFAVAAASLFALSAAAAALSALSAAAAASLFALFAAAASLFALSE